MNVLMNLCVFSLSFPLNGPNVMVTLTFHTLHAVLSDYDEVTKGAQ